MTGYGRGEAAGAGCRVVVECSSVNRKQLDAAALLPREYAGLEPRIREQISKSVQRGRVQAAVTIQAERAAVGGMLDPVAARLFAQELRALRQELELGGEVTLDQVLRHPAVLRESSAPADSGAVWPVVEKALAQALTAMLKMRREEGRHLGEDLARRIAGISKLAAKIAKRAPVVPRLHRAQLRKRLQAARLQAEISEARLAEEIALFAERCDVSEEVTRVQSHLKQFSQKLGQAGAQGRELEFLAQELTREFNTTGAKASDAAITKLVVEAKAELEKIREQ
ncbi:MAG TPA: YicC/YloC family endoribonuclease, partial [Chthoniobacterales bacterium]